MYIYTYIDPPASPGINFIRVAKRPGGAPEVRPRIRVTRGADIVIGPGKADLLDAIRRLETLRGAARELGLSYMRAWNLLQTMNGAFPGPLVVTERGGMRHGRAVLTPLGRTVLALYREMESESARAMAPAWRRLRRRLGRPKAGRSL